MTALPMIAPVSSARPALKTFFLGVAICEIAIGLAALLFADFAALFVPLSYLLGVCGVGIFLICILNPQATKIYDLFSATLLVAYGSGTLNSVISYAQNGEALLAAAVVPEYWLTRTLSLVGVACGCLHLAGRVDNDGYLFRPFTIEPRFRDRTLLLALSVLVAYAGFVLTGTIGFRGNVLVGDVAYRVSGPATIVLVLVTPVGALALIAMLQETRRLRALLLAFTAIALLVSQFGLGRRVFFFSLLTYALAALAFKPPKRLLTLKNIAVTVIALLLIQFSTSFFYAIRLADTSTNSLERAGLINLLPKAMDIYLDDSNKLQEKISSNLKSRAFVLQYLADVAQREAEIGPLFGLNTLRALIFATPNSLYPGKYQNPLFIQEESLINPHFLLPLIDSASSIFTAGLADFGTPGLLVYPLLLCIGFSIALRATRQTISPMAAVLASLFLCQILMSVENDLSSYFSSFLRAAVIVTIAAIFLYPRSQTSYTQPAAAIPTVQ